MSVRRTPIDQSDYSYNQYFFRHSIIPLAEGIEWLRTNVPAWLTVVPADIRWFIVRKLSPHTILNGVEVKTYSLRLVSFLVNGTACSKCGLEGTHFAIERDGRAEMNGYRYHINLWASMTSKPPGELHNTREEMLFTVDHTIARSLGGSHKLRNTTTMCSRCNNRKSRLENVLLEQLTLEQRKGHYV